MKAKIKIQVCEISGCNQKAVGAWQPKHRPDKKLWICRRHREQNDIDGFLWKVVGVRKPEKVHRPKSVIKNHKPKREGKAAWQKILDGWFKNGKYPVSNFMNKGRWNYWISIGGEKPKGESRKFKKEEAPIHPLLLHKIDKNIKANKAARQEIRRKKSY